MRVTPAIALFLLLPSGCGAPCGKKPCQLTALRLILPWSILKSQQGQIRTCVADRCSTAPVWVPPAGAGDFGHWIGTFMGPVLAGGTLAAQPTPAGAEPTYSLEVYLRVEDADTVEGDRYTLTVTDPASGQERGQAWVATYYDARPNGPDCDPPCRTPRLMAQP
jgi:hypothetical protein